MFFYFLCVKETSFILKEKVGKESVAALFLAITGSYLVIRPEGGFGFLEFSDNHFTGMASGLFAGLVLAIIIMNVRILKRDHTEFAIAFWGTAISCLLMTPFAFETSFSVLATNILPR